MGKKVLVSLEFGGAKETIGKLSEVELAMDKVRKALNEAKKAGNDDIYKQLRIEYESLKKTAQGYNAELRQQTAEHKKQKFPKDSVIGMELAYSKLREQVRGLSEDQRNSTFGKNLIRQADQIKTQILRVDGSIKDFKSNIGNYQSAFSGLGDLVTGGLLTGGLTAAAGAVISFGTSSAKEFNQAEKAALKLGQVYRTMGGVVGISLQQIQEDITQLEEKTGVDGDAIADNITAPLLSFKSVRGKIFTEAQGLALDLSKFFGTDMQSATLQLGKALEDPVKGLTALRRSGISFTKDQQLVIKSLVDTGQKAKAQEMILEEVAKQIGGQAEAQARPIDKLLVKWGNFQEKIGEVIVRTIEYFTPLGERMIAFWEAAFGKLKSILEPAIIGIQQFNNFIKESTGGWLDLGKALDFALLPLKAIMFIIGNGLQILTSFLGIIKTLSFYVYDKLSFAFSKLSDVVSPLINKFLSATGLGGAVKYVKDLFVDFVGTITKIPAILSAVGTTVKKVLSDLAKGSFDFEISKTYNKALKEYADLNGRTGRGGGKYNGKTDLLPPPPDDPAPPPPPIIKAAEGSIDALEESYKHLMTLLQNTPPDSPGLKKLIEKARLAKDELDDLKRYYDYLMKGVVGEAKAPVIDPLHDKVPDFVSDRDKDFANSEKKKSDEKIKIAADEKKKLEKLNEDEEKWMSKFAERESDRVAKQDEKLLASKKKRLGEEFSQEQIIWKKIKDGEKLSEEEKLALKKQFKQAAIDLAGNIADAIFELEAQKRQQDLDQKLKAVDIEYDKKLKAAQGNSTLEEAIKKELEEKKLAIQREAFEKDKKAKIAQAIIGAALAIINAFQIGPITGAIAAVGIGITTGLQIANIKRAKFAQGGFGKRGFTGKSNLPPDETGKRPAGIAVFHENEYFSPDWQVERHKPLFNALENERLSYMRGFASGGFSTPPQYVKPAYFSTSTQGNATFTDEQIVYMATRMGGIMAEMNAPAVEKGAARGAYNAATAINRNNERINSLENDF